ncbi:hypothetical protein B7486_56590 [cyanobacterium TDX16]|nr:hypothetical protein B7486_56590 [cyanobacterium TDX16]
METEAERPTGLTKDVGWEIGVSRTFRCDLDHAWQVLTSRTGVEVWLGHGALLPHQAGATWSAADGSSGDVRSFKPLDRVRLTHQAPGQSTPSTVQVALSERHAKDGPRTVVRFHQDRLADADQREAQRQHWQAVMDELAAELDR